MTQHRCPWCSFNKLLGSISIRDSEIPNLFSPSKPRGAIMRCSVNLCQWMVLHLCVLWIGMRISVVTESIKFCLRENSNIITVQCSTVDLNSVVYTVISVWPLTVQWFLLMHFKLHLAIEYRRQREMWFLLWGSLIGLSAVFARRCGGEVNVSKTRSASMRLTQIVLNVLWLNAMLKRSACCVCTSISAVKFCASENMCGKPQVSPSAAAGDTRGHSNGKCVTENTLRQSFHWLRLFFYVSNLENLNLGPPYRENKCYLEAAGIFFTSSYGKS